MKRIVTVPFALLFLAAAAVANPLCVQNALSVYETSFNGQANACQIGNLLFYDFTYSAVATGGAVAPAAGVIQVRPDASSPILNPGLIIASGSFFLFGGTMDATITYRVATVSGSALIKDYHLLIAGSHPGSGAGSGTVTESFSNLQNPLVTSFGPGAAQVVSGDVVFTPFVSGVLVTTTIHESSTGGDFITISGIQEHFSEQIPEPYAAVLIGSGLVLLGLRRKRAA